MGDITLITGGARSGKSRFAEELARKSALGGMGMPLFYIATGEPLDKEMQERIKKHKKQRGNIWKTIEEPKNVSLVLSRVPSGVVVIDCVTLWVNNHNGNIRKEVQKTLMIAKKSKFSTIIVTNEVGCGIVPENELARRYRDTLGMVNQMIAKKADTVYMMCSGIPVCIKGG